MSVTISDESGLAASANSSSNDLPQDSGAQLGEVPPPPEPEPVELAKAELLPKPVPPVTRAVAAPVQRPVTRPPTAGRTATSSVPPKQQQGKQQGKCATAFDRAYGTCGKNSDGSNFAPGGGPKGGGNPNTGKGKDPATGAQKVAWQNSVAARVQGAWQRCPVSGLDLEKLRMVVPFNLDRQGRVISIGEPRVSGQTQSNRTQIAPFRACAEKAIRLGAPYLGLPPEYYDQWNSRELTFSKGRAQ